jgi:hypothetical protein
MKGVFTSGVHDFQSLISIGSKSHRIISIVQDANERL